MYNWVDSLEITKYAMRQNIAIQLYQSQLHAICMQILKYFLFKLISKVYVMERKCVHTCRIQKKKHMGLPCTYGMKHKATCVYLFTSSLNITKSAIQMFE